MRITSVELYKGKVYCVELDDEEKLFFHRDIVYDFGLTQGMELDKSELEEILRASESRRARREHCIFLIIRTILILELLKSWRRIMMRTYALRCLTVLLKGSYR